MASQNEYRMSKPVFVCLFVQLDRSNAPEFCFSLSLFFFFCAHLIFSVSNWL